MTNAHVSFGVRCEKCGRSFGKLASVGGGPTAQCLCGGALVPDTQWENISNFKCTHCGTIAGHLTGNGPAMCLWCGKPL